MKLTSEEESCLKELVDIHKSGGSAAEFVTNKLFSELSHIENPSPGVYSRVEHDGYRQQKELYDGLAAKGYLHAYDRSYNCGRVYGDLTSEGRCYFDAKAEAKKNAKKEKWSERRFTIAMSILTFVLSILGSVIASRITTSRSLDELLSNLPLPM